MDSEERKAVERFMRKETEHYLGRTKFPITKHENQQYGLTIKK